MAGQVWRHLSAEGEQSLADVAKALDAKLDPAALAVGWLGSTE